MRELVGDDGTAIAEFMYSVMADEGSRTADRLEEPGGSRIVDLGGSPQDVELALKAQEGVDVHAFAAFAATYLPMELLDEMILNRRERRWKLRERCRKGTPHAGAHLGQCGRALVPRFPVRT